MIKYEKEVNKYLYDMGDIDNILNIISSSNFGSIQNCTKEKVQVLVDTINAFLSNIKVSKQKDILERHETEEEARNYFGDKFINAFDNLLTVLSQQETVAFIHGTSPDICPKICETGLKCHNPGITSTAVSQGVHFDQKDIHYKKYEGLLNWAHRNYKGLVIVAVPYECYYKEGLWKKTDNNEEASIYSGQKYRIDPDFIVGYVDVEEKKIVFNHNYKRKHDYQGYVEDNDIFHKINGLDNKQFLENVIKSMKDLEHSNEQKKAPKTDDDESLNPQNITIYIEALSGIFNSVKYGFPDAMTEDRYKMLLEQLSYNFDKIPKILPYLKTNKEVEEEELKQREIFEQALNASTDDSELFDWDNDFSWDYPDENTPKSR